MTISSDVNTVKSYIDYIYYLKIALTQTIEKKIDKGITEMIPVY